MTSSQHKLLNRNNSDTIAYHVISGNSPGILFCSGYRSDMTGTKANMLSKWCSDNNYGFVRFDYSGHGKSSGNIEKLTLSHWIKDAISILDCVTEGPQIIVGSSMGAWIMIHLALLRPNRITGLIGISSAPDFTENLIWKNSSNEERSYLQKNKIWRQPSNEEGIETVITLDLIEDGRKHLILHDQIPINVPVRLIHGTDDRTVPWETSVKLMQKITSDNITLNLIKGGHHRLSRIEEIKILLDAIRDLID